MADIVVGPLRCPLENLDDVDINEAAPEDAAVVVTTETELLDSVTNNDWLVDWAKEDPLFASADRTSSWLCSCSGI